MTAANPAGSMALTTYQCPITPASPWVETAPWSTPEEVTERIIQTAEHAGANIVRISLNRGAMPHQMFMEQIHRFADKVLPAVQAHQIKSVPLAEAAA